MGDETPNRRGLNAAEAAMVWAYAHLGGDPEAVELLEADAAAGVSAAVESVAGLEGPERHAVVERWRRIDRRWSGYEQLAARLDRATLRAECADLAPRWRRVVAHALDDHRSSQIAPHNVRSRRAVIALALSFVEQRASSARPDLTSDAGFDVSHLAAMEPFERRRFVRRLGVFYLTELARRQDRRQIVRLRRSLPAEDRPLFDRCMKQPPEVERLARGRLREVFVAASRREPDLSRRLVHLGAYVIAAAAGRRFAARLASVADELSGELGNLLIDYHLFDARAGLCGLEVVFREGLDAYMARLGESKSRGAR